MFIKIDEKQFDNIITKFKELVYDYNSKIKVYDVYLKPFHVVHKNGKKYFYIGKYWYKLEKINGKLKWIYLGKEKPVREMPDPPKFPEFTIIKDNNDYLIDEKLLYHFK